MKPVALTIAGSDPSGGAGLQADLKTFHQFGVYGESVVTLLTAQNTCELIRVLPLEPGFVAVQLRAVVSDIPPQAAKTGALGSRAMVETVAALARGFNFPLVVDPVMISKHGSRLMDENAQDALIDQLLPCAVLVTPNLAEAAALAGREVSTTEDMRDAAKAIHQKTGAAVLVKGGHLEGAAVDILYFSSAFHNFAAERVWTPHTHGTGCTFSAAITACLAIGLDLPEAVERAKIFITEAIRTNPGLGSGCGPVNHHAHPIQ